MKEDASTENRILAAARKIFIDKGLDGARMQDIADEAGINKAMLHYYFRSKEKLFETIFIKVADEFLPKIFGLLQSEAPFFDKIERFCITYIDQEIETPYVPMFIVNELNRDPQGFLERILKGRKAPFEMVLGQMQQAITEKIIIDIEPIQLLLNIVSLCVFPFLARPMVQTMTGMNIEEFNQLMERRKQEVPRFIINSIKFK